jgi:hypothetical protein
VSAGPSISTTRFAARGESNNESGCGGDEAVARSRFGNTPIAELKEAAQQQMQITELRLAQLWEGKSVRQAVAQPEVHGVSESAARRTGVTAKHVVRRNMQWPGSSASNHGWDLSLVAAACSTWSGSGSSLVRCMHACMRGRATSDSDNSHLDAQEGTQAPHSRAVVGGSNASGLCAMSRYETKQERKIRLAAQEQSVGDAVQGASCITLKPPLVRYSNRDVNWIKTPERLNFQESLCFFLVLIRAAQCAGHEDGSV